MTDCMRPIAYCDRGVRSHKFFTTRAALLRGHKIAWVRRCYSEYGRCREADVWRDGRIATCVDRNA